MRALRKLIVEIWFKSMDLLLLVIPAKTLLRFFLRVDNRLYKTLSYLGHKWEGEHPKHRLMKGFHGFFVENVSAKDRVLDLGCGTGAVAWDVAQKARHVVGIDMNARSIEWARRRYARDNLEFICGRAPEALPDVYFDVVILSNVLEHIKQRTEFLKQLVQQTGVRQVLIRVPMFSRDWRVPLKKELGVEWRGDGTHEIEYEMETFYAEMEGADLVCDLVSVNWGEIYAVCHPKARGIANAIVAIARQDDRPNGFRVEGVSTSGTKELHERDWQEKKTDYTAFAGQARFPVLVSTIKEIKPQTLLDIGCGSGYLAFLLKHEMPELRVHGIDISEAALEQAQVLDVKHLVNLDREPIPEPDNSFDVVVCSEVLEHLYAPEAALREIRRVLKRGGTVLTTVPNFGYWRYRRDALLGKVPAIAADPRHLHTFDADLLRSILERQGFRVRRMTGCDGRPPLRRISTRLFSKTLVAQAEKS